MYLAETAECAYAEVLAYTKRRLGQQDPLTKDAAEGLYRLVDAAYEKRSVAISSNLHPAASTS